MPKWPRSNTLPILEILGFAFFYNFHIYHMYFVPYEFQPASRAICSKGGSPLLLYRTSSGITQAHVTLLRAPTPLPSFLAYPTETPHKTSLGLSTPMGRLKPPSRQLGSRLWYCASNHAESAGAGCPFLLPGCTCCNKFRSRKKAFPLLYLKQPIFLQPITLHSFLHLTAGQAIHPFPITAARVLLSAPSPFLFPGDFISGPRMPLQKGAAHFCRNLSKHTRRPNQRVTTGRSSSVHQVTDEHVTSGSLCPPRESFLRTLPVPHHTRCVPAAQENRNSLKVGTKEENASGRQQKLPHSTSSGNKSLSKLCVFVQREELTGFYPPRWCNIPEHLGEESFMFISPLLPSFATSIITCVKPFFLPIH